MSAANLAKDIKKTSVSDAQQQNITKVRFEVKHVRRNAASSVKKEGIGGWEK